jgi:hypothetical protein
MTKQQEILRIRQLADALGPQSYFGPVLKRDLPAIEMAIRSDIEPDSVLDTMRRAVEVRDAALAEVKELKAVADDLRNILAGLQAREQHAKNLMADIVVRLQRAAANLS